uniref:A-kinase anchor inhibitor 1 n=1 Tax=Podarcis muralis TaxID=64176 RepID=A0A670IBD0_PODMU
MADSGVAALISLYWPREPAYRDKCGNEQEEAKLQNMSKQIVHTVIQQAVQQLSQESRQKEKARHSSGSLQLERGQLTKKHEKK